MDDLANGAEEVQSIKKAKIEGRDPVDLDLELVLGKMPQKVTNLSQCHLPSTVKCYELVLTPCIGSCILNLALTKGTG